LGNGGAHPVALLHVRALWQTALEILVVEHVAEPESQPVLG